jgi:hypothetical protein
MVSVIARVAHRMSDVLVAEIILDRAGVVTVAGQLVARGMAQHVRMHLEWQLGLSVVWPKAEEASRACSRIPGYVPITVQMLNSWSPFITRKMPGAKIEPVLSVKYLRGSDDSLTIS